MRTEVQNVPERRPSILKRAMAGLVLVAGVILVFHFIVGLIVTVFYFVAGLAVIAAVVWALKTLVW